MKKIFCLLCMVIMLMSVSYSVFAGDIPESLLYSDDAQIFFAEVVFYHPHKEKPDIEFSPVKKIKGDVKIGTKQIAYNFNTIGDFEVKEGNVYLFTYFDENNPTDIFEVTSYETKKLKLKNVEGDMWERFEKYINDGTYEKAEHERLDKVNEELTVAGQPISLTALLGVEKHNAKEINIHYNGQVYEIDVEEFYKAIEGIMLTDIENVPMSNNSLTSGMYITINGFDGYAFISDDCKVDKYGLHFSRLPFGAYTISFADKAKIVSLFDKDYYKLPPLVAPFNKPIVYIVLFVIAFAVVFTAIKITVSKNKK